MDYLELNIASVAYNKSNDFLVTLDDGCVAVVPNSQEHRHYHEIQHWINQGNTVTPYSEPSV